jgi:hypothetical protein
VILYAYPNIICTWPTIVRDALMGFKGDRDMLLASYLQMGKRILKASNWKRVKIKQGEAAFPICR